MGCGCAAGAGAAAASASATDAGVGAGEGNERHAITVDPEIKARNLRRLKRIEGQVRGLQRMVEEERYCAEILTQLSSVQEALRAVGRELMKNHLRHCASTAIRNGEETAEPMYDELIELMYKHIR
jgi:DNA-binding FrmR family transcriptional regulator